MWAFENVRKEEQKKFMIMFRRYFKRSKSLLIKRYKYLTDEQKQEVNIMLYKSEKILKAYSLKEDFLQVLDYARDIKREKELSIVSKIKKRAIKLLSDWIMYAQNSKLLPFEKCASTMQNWSTGILNSIEYPYSNGFTEGCNNKIKVFKRCAYGYRNFKRFRNRILHIFRHQNYRDLESTS